MRRLVCPFNDERTTCGECRVPFPHRREELTRRRRVRCDLHRVDLVPA